MKAVELYFYVVLFIMLCKVILTCKSVNETLVCDHSCSPASLRPFFRFRIRSVFESETIRFKMCCSSSSRVVARPV